MNTSCASTRTHFALLQPTEWALSLEKSIEFDLEPGDIVRGCQGLVWATVDGEPQDVMLTAGDTYEVPRPQRMRFNGFDAARMVILARGPVSVRTPRTTWERAVDHWTTAIVERWLLGTRGLRA